jgi:hypothetical protein
MEDAKCFKIVATEFNNQGELLTIRNQFAKEGSEFKEWIDTVIDLNYHVTGLCVGGFGIRSIEVNDERIIGYAMKDGWKVELINNIVDTISVEKCDRFICDFGIRNAYNCYENNGLGDECDECPILAEDYGMKQLMFHILYDIVVLCDEIEEIETKEFEKLFDGDMDDDDDTDDDVIVPITIESREYYYYTQNQPITCHFFEADRDIVSSLSDDSTFKRFLIMMNIHETDHLIAVNGGNGMGHSHRILGENYNTYGYSLVDNWKEKLIYHILKDLSIEDMKQFLGELNISYPFLKLLVLSGEDFDETDTDTDVGLEHLFYAVFRKFLVIGKHLTQVSEEAYNQMAWSPPYVADDNDDDDNDDDDTDDDDDVIVPITDEELDRISGEVASCA